MSEKLLKLYNTMLLIETKGESTKLMANCLNYLAQLVNESNKPLTPKVEESKEERNDD